MYLLPVAIGSRSRWAASPGVMSEQPASLGRFFWVAALSCSAIARWQEATDRQSPEGGCQRACQTRGAHPTSSFLDSRMAARSRSLWVASPGSESSPSSLARMSLTAWVQLTIGPHVDDLFAERGISPFFSAKTVSTVPSARRRNFTTIKRALSAIGRHRSCRPEHPHCQ